MQKAPLIMTWLQVVVTGKAVLLSASADGRLIHRESKILRTLRAYYASGEAKWTVEVALQRMSPCQ